jgi:hypothetical protein
VVGGTTTTTTPSERNILFSFCRVSPPCLVRSHPPPLIATQSRMQNIKIKKQEEEIEINFF